MSLEFEFASPRLIFGPGKSRSAAGEIAALGRRALLVQGRDSSRHAGVLDSLRAAGLALHPFSLAQEPRVADAKAALRELKLHSCDLVIGLGGGSVIDLAKAVAALAGAGEDFTQHLEVVGLALPLPPGSLPSVAIPTSAGTGAEATRNAVLRVEEAGLKVSLRGPQLVARLALVDPELTLSLPPAVTAATGMDALTQLLEAFVSPAATPLSDGFCREGLKRSGFSLRRAFHQGDDLEARTDLALAATLSGLALAHSKLGSVHGFAAPLGGARPAPHGAVCAALLSECTRVNVEGLREADPHHPALARYAEAACLLLNMDAPAEVLPAYFETLRKDLGIPRLGHWGFDAAALPGLAEAAGKASSMKGNPLALGQETRLEILKSCL